MRIPGGGFLQGPDQFIGFSDLLGDRGGHLVGRLDTARTIRFQPDLFFSLDATHQEKGKKAGKQDGEMGAHGGECSRVFTVVSCGMTANRELEG